MVESWKVKRAVVGVLVATGAQVEKLWEASRMCSAPAVPSTMTLELVPLLEMEMI